jgi:hypothetical protein
MDLNTETITISLGYTLKVLPINKIFKPHIKFSQADLLYSSVLLVPICSVRMLPPLLSLYQLRNSAHCYCVTSQHMRKLMDTRESRHVMATYCCCVTSPLLRQLPDTRKTQLALLLRVRIVFTGLLPTNTLTIHVTICSSLNVKD